MRLQLSHRTLRAAFATGALLTLVGIGATTALRAQTNNGKGAKGGPSVGSGAPKKKERFVDFVSGQFSDTHTAQGELRTAWGSVVIKSEDTTLKTDQAIYNKKTEIASSPGKLQIDDSQNTINGDTGTAFYRTRDAIITGKNVVMILRPKQDDKNTPEGSARREFKSPAKITCTKVEYNWRTRIATATGNLTIKYEDRTVTADKAIYYGAEETVELVGNVKYTRPNGDKGEAKRAIAKLKEGAEAFYAEGEKGKQLSGTLQVTGDDEDETTPKAAAPAIPTVGTSPAETPAAQPTPPSVPNGPAPNAPTPPPAETPPTGPAKTTGEGTTPANPPATPPATAPETTPTTKP